MKVRISLLLLIFLFCSGLSSYLFYLYVDYSFNQQKIIYQKDIETQLDKLFKGTNKIVEAKMGSYAPDTIRLNDSYLPWDNLSYNPSVYSMPESNGFEIKRKFLYKSLKYEDIKDLEVLWEILFPEIVWEIVVLEETEFGYYAQYEMKPLAVGYKKLNDRYEKEFRPSLYNCCKGAFNYMVENNEEIKYFYTPSQTNRISKFKWIENKYYHVGRLRDLDWTPQKPSYQYYENDPKKRSQLEQFESLSCIFNYYSKTFYTKSKTDYYNFYFDEITFNNDKKSFLYKGLKIILILIFIIFLISLYLTLKKNRRKRLITLGTDNQVNTNTNQEQSIDYIELLSKCSPINFMDPYDSKKVALANKIYSSVLENKNNICKLKKLRIEAEEKLQIKF